MELSRNNSCKQFDGCFYNVVFVPFFEMPVEQRLCLLSVRGGDCSL